jgi:hypothetical protein
MIDKMKSSIYVKIHFLLLCVDEILVVYDFCLRLLMSCDFENAGGEFSFADRGILFEVKDTHYLLCTDGAAGCRLV